MTRKEAISAVRSQVETSLTTGLTISSAGQHWQVTPEDLGVQANISKSVTQAMKQTESLPWWERVYHRIADKPVHSSTAVHYDYDQTKVSDFVQDRDQGAGAAAGRESRPRRRQGRPPEGEARAGAEGAVRGAAAAERAGASTELGYAPGEEGAARLEGRRDDDRGAPLREPAVPLRRFKLEKSYPVATAMPGFTTPVGTWQIVNKVENPTWVNPAPTGWGAGEPATILPGPGNPLGTRALYLNAPVDWNHGTHDTGSTGTYASHGCIRMTISDSEDLYPRVPIGSTVLITQ